jgi:quercetin dioxygenase-like cupin family protein
MIKGWFVGDFEPSVLRSKDFEVALKYYRAGEQEDEHHHRVAIEITVVVSGKVKMLGRIWEAGDIVVVEPGEASSFEAITDSANVVVKMPSVTGDKYAGTLPL